ncbi:MAG: hypothetical protein Q7N50_06575 [Armatimonadota bacterium]|nr:hypothetical protein [Armatimonadota bacterium]
MMQDFLESNFPTFKAAARAGYRLVKLKFMASVRIGRKLVKPVIVVFIVMLVAHAILMLVWGRQLENRREQIRKSGDPVSPSDLMLKPVPDSENAAVIYQRAFRLFGRPHGLYSSPIDEYISVREPRISWAKVEPVMRKSVQDAAPIYPLIREALARPKCVFPVNWSEGPMASFLHVGKLSEMGRLQLAKAILEARDGNTDAAIDDICITLQLSDALKDEPRLISQLIRYRLIQMVSVSLEDISNIHPLTPRQAKIMRDEMNRIELQPGFMAAMKGERTIIVWFYDAVRKDWSMFEALTTIPNNGPEYVPESLRKAGNIIMTYLCRPFIYKGEMISMDFWEEQIRLVALPYPELDKQKSRLDPWLETPKYAIVTRLFFNACISSAASKESANARLGLAQVAMALQAYKAEAGAYPASLAELKSKIDWALPEDPFTGKPLIYNRVGKGFKLYSFGMNMKDDGGVPLDNMVKSRLQGKDDIVWTSDL